jgi:hypothetical protein
MMPRDAATQPSPQYQLFSASSASAPRASGFKIFSACASL